MVSSYIYGKKLLTSAYGWYQYNAHGDVVSLANDSGIVTCNYDYDPFGIQLSLLASGDKNPYRYSGEYYDSESGLAVLNGTKMPAILVEVGYMSHIDDIEKIVNNKGKNAKAIVQGIKKYFKKGN